MKKFLLLFLSVWIAFACSEEKEIPSIEPPIVNPEQNEAPKPAKADSIYYQLNVDGVELVAATEDSTCLFLQTDTTFAFRCLFDSCGSNRLLAYCDSTGLVERIVADDQIVNILHHADKKKMDIFYKDAEGKMAWIKDVESPYKDLSSRAEGDVPYSAISIVNDLSYAVYTIINTYDVAIEKPRAHIINKYSRKEFYNMRSTVALKLIVQILGEEYKVSVSNHISTIVTVMSDYSKWVIEELYGDAIPHLRTYATRFTSDRLMMAAYVTDVDPEKTDFKVGVIVAEEGDPLDAFHFLQNVEMEYNSKDVNYLCQFPGLATGKNYKFRAYLAPTSKSKYATGMKGLLDYYKMNFSKDYLLLETKAQLISDEREHATLKLSVKNAQSSIKMGVIYSEHSDLLEHEYKKVEYESTFGEGLSSNDFEKEVTLEKLKTGYTYYMPYVIYDDDIIKRQIYYTDTILSATLTEGNFLFYGKKDSIVSNPITGDAELDGNTLKFKGRFYTELENDITEYGICYSKDNKDITVENSSVLKANAHQNGNFEASIINGNNIFYYRAYIKVKNKYYYGKIERHKEVKVYLCSEINSLYLILGMGSSQYFYSDEKKTYFSQEYLKQSVMVTWSVDDSSYKTYVQWVTYTEYKCVLGCKTYDDKEKHLGDNFKYTFRRIDNKELQERAEHTIINSSFDVGLFEDFILYYFNDSFVDDFIRTKEDE